MKEKVKLKEILSQFQGANGNLNELTKQFYRLAKYFFYDGYLLVNNDSKIYLRDVEFYYHEEISNIKDYIMYHRNTKKNQHVEYLPLGFLNTHKSGIDITFENERKQYRASMLIRGFNLLEGQSVLPSSYDRRSTYIYKALFMQYSLLEKICVEWIHEPTLPAHKDQIEVTHRVNVCEYDGNGKKKIYDGIHKCTENKKYVQDEREWRFIRKIG